MKNLQLSKHQSYTLGILQKLRRRQYLKIKDHATRDPAKFIEIVKSLIDIGFCEYEFSNDYKEVRRLDLPDYAIDYFTKLKLEYEQTEKNNQQGKKEPANV